MCLWEIFSGKDPLLSKASHEHTTMCTAGLQRPIPESCPAKIASLIGQVHQPILLPSFLVIFTFSFFLFLSFRIVIDDLFLVKCWKKAEDRPSISGVLRQLEGILDELRTEESQNMKTGFRKVEFADVMIGECIGVGAFGKVKGYLTFLSFSLYACLFFFFC